MMENHKTLCASTSNVTDYFKFIPFVVASKETNPEIINKTIPNDNLNGAQAKQFYEEVISSPPTSSSVLKHAHKKNHKMTRKNAIASVIPEIAKLTIFHHAQNGNIEGIEHYLSKQCHVDVQDMYGWTPLMCATFEGHYSAVEYLLKKGAKFDMKNKQGLSAFDIAVQKHNTKLIELFQNGIMDDTSKSNVNNKINKDIKFCKLCNISYEESVAAHERSISHLFCSQDGNISTYYHIPENNKGFQIMLKKGWDKNKGLGINAKGRKYPIKTVLKADRTCIGGKKEVSKVTHFGPNDYNSVKNSQRTTLNLKREKKINKQKLKRLEKRNRQLEIDFRRQFHGD